MAADSCGEQVLRSAAIVEQTFGGLTANLWDDPFEWTLPETLSTSAKVIEYLNEVEATRQDPTYYGDRIFGAFATGLRTSSWVPALIALGFATGFVHYLLDRSVYRMSDPEVRAAARGLLSVSSSGAR